jgi:hypothetical protein
MFGNKKLQENINKLNLTVFQEIKNSNKRIDKIEKQLKPEPSFKSGDIVNFFLIDNEFRGKIIDVSSKISNYGMWYYRESDVGKWIVEYLDKNDVIQTVEVKEEDIWSDEEDVITDIYEQIEELRYQVEFLKGKNKKNGTNTTK